MKHTRSTTSITEARTRVQGLQKLIRNRVLTDQEEKVIRMRYGISEPESAELHFRGQNNEETRNELAEMERNFIDQINGVDPERVARKERIIAKLRLL